MINKIIYWELYALVVSFFNGVLLAWIYDNIRAFRRIVRHKTVVFMSVEDIIYGIYAGLSVFVMCFKVADGIIRGFIIMGIAVGAFLYFKFLSSFLYKVVSKNYKIFTKTGMFYIEKCGAYYYNTSKKP